MLGYGYDGDDGNAVSTLRDMFDGGGAGRSGPRFEGGGALSSAANTVFRPSGSRDRGEADMRTGVMGLARDAIDGGGWNNSGNTFEGGGLYGRAAGSLMNMAGVRPLGYEARQQTLPGVLEAIMAGIAPQAGTAGLQAPSPIQTQPMPNYPNTGPAGMQTMPNYPNTGPAGMPAQMPDWLLRSLPNYAPPMPQQMSAPSFPPDQRRPQMVDHMRRASPFGGN